jgi:peroxiredoxin
MSVRVYALIALAALGCGGSTSNAPPPASSAAAPLWTRPGFEGAVRPEMGPPQPGDAAPDFELPMTGHDGSRYRLSSRRGRWVVVHFTTTWCPFCDEEVEHLDRLAGDYAGRNVEALLIDVLEEPSQWNSYLEGRLPVGKLMALSDQDGSVARSYAPPHFAGAFTERAHVVLASTLIVDPEGKIQLFLIPDSKRFDPTFAAVRTRLDELLPPAPAAGTLTPDQAVSVTLAAPMRTAPGGHGDVQVTLAIAPGYHVMANPASKPNYIPTRVQIDAEGVRFGAPIYPVATRFQLWDEAIDTFQGSAVVSVPFDVAADTADGVYRGTCKVEFQACSEGSCLFPFTRVMSFELGVLAAR